jgi:hypothetical protein
VTVTQRDSAPSYWARIWASYWASLSLAALSLAGMELARRSYAACALWTLAGTGWGVQWALGSKGYTGGRLPSIAPPLFLGWRPRAWTAFILFMTALAVAGDLARKRPSWEAPFDAITGLWCAYLLASHFLDGAADRLGRAIVPVSILVGGVFAAVYVFHVPQGSSDWRVSFLDTMAVGGAVVFPIAFGIRRGLEYWRSPTRSP